jgi:hypothetical protein
MSCCHVMSSYHAVMSCCHIMSSYHVMLSFCHVVMLCCYVAMLCHVMLCHVLMHYVFKKSCPVIIPCGHVLVSSSGVDSSWGIREFSKSIAETNPGWPNIFKTLSLLWGWLPTGRRLRGRTRPRDALYLDPPDPPGPMPCHVMPRCHIMAPFHDEMTWRSDM